MSIKDKYVTELTSKFEACVDIVQNGTAAKKPTQEEKLEFYALFKQATQGDAPDKKPSFFDMVAFAKWTAWDKLRGQSQEQAMQTYVDRVEKEKSTA